MEPPLPVGSTNADARQRDADIVALLAAGDVAAAFDQLVARYEAKVYRLCWTLLRHDASAQEAAQDALVRVWQALGRFDAGRAALSTWIYAITRNRCLSLLELRHAPESSISQPEVQDEVEQLPAPSTTADGDALAVLRRLVDALPEARRHVVLLYYYEERSVSDVAAMLGLPEGTIKTHLHRARSELLQQLERMGLADPCLWL